MFDEAGKLLGSARHPIRVWHEPGDIVEQSSDDIWAACVASVRNAMREAAVAAEHVKGIGFDATCSLVVLDAAGRPLTVSPSGDPARNVVVWMDHRAMDETEFVNATGDRVLRYVGGAISPEMEIPKILWLKRHLPATFEAAGHFFDLADYLSFRATGSLARSTCTVTCKWTYVAGEGGWSESFLKRVGLEALAADRFARIGSEIVPPGSPLGRGLSEDAARDLGLMPGAAVGASLIDAACRWRRRDRRPRRLRRRGRCLPAARLHHGNVGLHHGDHGRALFRAGCLGSVFRGHGAGLLAQRGRPVRRGGRDRSSAEVASGACRGSGRGEERRHRRHRISRKAHPGARTATPAPPRCWRTMCMCCLNSSATARPMPIPARAR